MRRNIPRKIGVSMVTVLNPRRTIIVAKEGNGAMTTLDKRRPYGEIVGYHRGARYEQDGKLFSATGKWIDEPEAPEPKVEAVKVQEIKKPVKRVKKVAKR
jgi:hypothetical protein